MAPINVTMERTLWSALIEHESVWVDLEPCTVVVKGTTSAAIAECYDT